MVLFRVSVLFLHAPQLTAWSQKASVVALVMMGLSFLLGAPVIVQSYRAKVPFSGYVILSSLPSVFVVPTVTFGTAAGFSGIAPLWLFAAIWEMLVMALALADRFFQERHAKMTAQQDLIDSLKQSEHELEVKVAQRTEQLAHSEAKAKDLLYNMLPVEVAAELSSTGTTQPVRHESATVLFTDFAGFTQVASTMPADQMVHELNAIFAGFDDICDECGIEKIKTIGDAYMAAGGVPKACADHAQRCVNAGLRMIAFMQVRNLDSAFKWGLRVGVHSGPVVAGVVGKRKFAFDIWGDSVNIASRMESAGEVGKVNVSAYTYHLIRKDFECAYRGKLDAKGKGEVDMYFVTHSKAKPL
jgi:class 3 adenylate cyclase